MKSSTLLALIAVYAAAQPQSTSGALLADWHLFNTSTATFPRSATSKDSSIDTAVMNNPVNVTKVNDNLRFNLSAWNTGGTVDTSEYFEVSLTINSGYTVDFSDVTFYARNSGTALTMHVRSDANGDNFATDLGSFATSSSVNTVHTTPISTLNGQSGTVKFRFFGTGATGAGTSFYGINNASFPGGGFLEISGTVTAVPEPGLYASVCGLALLGFAVWRRGCGRKSVPD